MRAESNTPNKFGYGRGRALLQDLSDAGMEVLPSKYPDSGTAGRNALMNLIGLGSTGAGVYAHDPSYLLPLGFDAVNAGRYTERVNGLANDILRRMSQPAGPTRNALAEMARTAGAVTAPAPGLFAGSAIPTVTVRPGQQQ